jgi:PrtD family type I secretion system ABC transporter
MLLSYFVNRVPQSPLAPVMAACRRALRSISIASGVINVLTLTGSIFMMQVYDRVLGSQSLPTLAGLAIIAVVAYLFQGWLEVIRGRILTLIGEKIDADLGPVIHAAGVQTAITYPGGQQEAIQAVRDLDAIRGFVAGAGLVAAFDLPWLLLYILVAGLLHPLFGLTVFAAGVLLIWLTWQTEQKSKPLLKLANDANLKRMQTSDGIARYSETVAANGMREDMARRLLESQTAYLAAQRDATFVISGYGTAAKTIRMLLQSFVLGLGAYLAIKGQITSGAIIAGTILVSRALAPIDMAINSWRPFVAAREGHDRLIKLLVRTQSTRQLTTLAAPHRTFSARDLSVAAPGAQTIAISGVSFQLKAGQAMSVIGHSAAGKSSLLRGLVGTWKPLRGAIAFDGTGPEQWQPDALGKCIGYLSQDIQLFEGTIAENIARFDPTATVDKILAAADAAGLDAYIRSAFPKTGYDTPITAGGTNLSGGQRQRIGLARALYGDPFLVVLDEPNSNLDAAGREALQLALRSIKARGGIAIVSAHDHNVLAECDAVLTLFAGQFEFLGPRDETMKKWLAKHYPGAGPQAANANTPLPMASAAANTPPHAALPVRLPERAPPQAGVRGLAVARHPNAADAQPIPVPQAQPIQMPQAQSMPVPPAPSILLPPARAPMSWSTQPTKLSSKPKGGV